MDILTYIDQHFVWFVSHLLIILIIIGILLWNTFCKVRKLRREITKLENKIPSNRVLGMKSKLNRDITRLKRKSINNDLENT